MANQRTARKWFLGEEDESRPYFVGLFSARADLQQKGLAPQDVVWGTEVISSRETRQPRTVEMFAWRAAEVMALNQFRLATPEEIENEKKAMREREGYCAAQEALNRKERSLHLTTAFSEALKQLGPDLATKGKGK